MNTKSAFCPACGYTSSRAGFVTISPWVRKLAKIKSRSSRYYLCGRCGSGSFGYRYSDQEMQGIYGQYRGDRYFLLRNSWEPTYTEALNSDIGIDPEVLRIRQDVIASAAERSEIMLDKKIDCVVDIGGDRGQFIPIRFQHKYVLEVSDSSLVSGVQRLNNFEELPKVDPQLVLLCGILEHVESPKNLVGEVIDSLDPNSKTLVYIEVPFGVPFRRESIGHLIGWIISQIMVRSLFTWKILDNYVARRRRQQKPDYFQILRQSEHINFFSEEGMRNLGKDLNLEVLEVFTYEMSTKLAKSGRLEFSRVLCAMMVKS